MALTVDNVATYVTQNRDVKFMKAGDYSTASKDEAKNIQAFLTNKSVREAREKELANYLLGMKDEKGNSIFTKKEAESYAEKQVENEMSQKRAQRTVLFIDKAAYEKAVADAKKDGSYELYDFKLIDDKKVLDVINGNGLRTLEQKEENYKKFFKTDESGNLVKDAKGQYIFDSDKFKNEFGKDVDIDNKLQLSERQAAADRRGISETTEKNAIKYIGLDYRKDNTGLIRGLVGTAALAAILFGGASAEAGAFAAAGGNKAVAYTAVSTNIGRWIGGASLLTLPFLQDKDGKAQKRTRAAEVFQPKPESPKEEPKVEPKEEPKVEPKEEPKVEPKEEPKVEVKKEPEVHPHKLEANYEIRAIGQGMSATVAAVYGVPEGSAAHKAIMKEMWDKNPGLRNKNLKLGDKVYLPEKVNVNGKEYNPNLEAKPKDIAPKPNKLGRYGGYQSTEWWGKGKTHVDDNEIRYRSEKEAKEAK